MTICSSAVAVCAGAPASVTTTENSAEPACVGVPEIAPVRASSDSPAGSDEPGASAQLYGCVPPDAASEAVYGWPTVPPGSVAVVIVSFAAAIVIERCAVAVCCGVDASVTATVNDVVPGAVGVPAIVPSVLRVKPAGSDDPAASAQL